MYVELLALNFVANNTKMYKTLVQFLKNFVLDDYILRSITFDIKRTCAVCTKKKKIVFLMYFIHGYARINVIALKKKFG